MMTDVLMPKLDARVRLYAGPSSGKAELLGFADLVIADSFLIRGVRILRSREGEDGGGPGREAPGAPFLGFPSRKAVVKGEERWVDVAHPLTPEAREAAALVVLEAYANVLTTRRGG